MESLYLNDNTEYFNDEKQSIETLSQYLGLLESLGEEQFFFRGQKDKTWPIISSLSRAIVPPYKYLEKIGVDEDYLEEGGKFSSEQEIKLDDYISQNLKRCYKGYSDFKRSLPSFFHEVPQKEFIINSAFSFLAIAQHYGLPTRLIDWSLSPVIALFFAVNGSDENSEGAVYIYEPDTIVEGEELWRGVSNFLISRREEKKRLAKGFDVVLDDVNTEYYFAEFMIEKGSEPSKIFKNFLIDKLSLLSMKPESLDFAIVHDLFDRRMIAQRCAFTYQNNIKSSFKTKNRKIKKIVIKNPLGIKNELSKIGIVASSIYPSIEGLAYEIKDRYFYTQN